MEEIIDVNVSRVVDVEAKDKDARGVGFQPNIPADNPHGGGSSAPPAGGGGAIPLLLK